MILYCTPKNFIKPKEKKKMRTKNLGKHEPNPKTLQAKLIKRQKVSIPEEIYSNEVRNKKIPPNKIVAM